MEYEGRQPDWVAQEFKPTENFPTEGHVWRAIIKLGVLDEVDIRFHQEVVQAGRESHEAYTNLIAVALSGMQLVPERVDPIAFTGELFTHVRPPTL